MDIYINGIGIVSRAACSKAELEAVCAGKAELKKELPLSFPVEIPASRLRRNSRYNKLACAAADQALKDASVLEQIAQGSLDPHQIGTILSTGYGASEYNSVFMDAAVRGDPNVCSPSVFSGSVPNSCLGQICIINHLNGFSTVLAGGDPLEYSALLLKTGRAKQILAGSVEEYFPSLYEAFGTMEAAKGCELSEGAAMALLSCEKTDGSYCRIIGFSSIHLGNCPYLHLFENPDDLTDMLAVTLRKFQDPEIIFSAGNGTWFDRAEENAIQKVFPDKPVRKLKTEFGETLGCGYMMNMLTAAAAIHRGDYSAVLVSGVDMIGNYMCVMPGSI